MARLLARWLSETSIVHGGVRFESQLNAALARPAPTCWRRRQAVGAEALARLAALGHAPTSKSFPSRLLGEKRPRHEPLVRRVL